MVKNNIFIIIVIVFVLLYFFKTTENMVPERKEKKNERKEFIPSKKFIGAKKGYVFKRDSKGLAYYYDI